MEYLLKVNAVIVIYYLCYKLFLERDTFFEWNRWFLLLGLVTSFMIPCIVIPNYIEYTAITLPNFSINEQVSLDSLEESYTILDYISFVYALGIVFFLIRFFIQLKSLSSLIYKNKGIKKDQFNLVQTRNNTSPFSFFNWIVYNPEKFSKTELEQIIAHEIVHAKQYHSIDVLMVQLFCIVFWFNPFVWFYMKDLKQNLEFIADENAQQKSDCKKSYQYTLLKTSMPTHQLEIVNNFYSSLIKKRIVMLQKSKSKKINQFKFALVIPLLAVFLVSCNSENETNSIKEEQLSPWVVSVGVNKDSTNIAPIVFLDGKEISSTEMKNINPDNIKSVDVFKDEMAIEKYGNKGKNGVVIITTKGNADIDEGKPMSDVRVTGYGETSDSVTKIRIGQKTEIKKGKHPLVIVDGKELPYEKLEQLDEDDIESMNVVKNEKAIQKHGDKGKKGVIEITTKK